MVRLLIIFFCCVQQIAGAQGIVFEAAEKFPSHVNSDCEDIFPLVSPGGSALYFVRASCYSNTGGKFAGTDVWVCYYDSVQQAWSKPVNTKNVFNDKAHNAVVGISEDGNMIYQLNTASGKDPKGIFVSKRSGTSWSEPRLVPLHFLNPEEFIGLYVAPDLSLILVSMKNPDSKGQEDIYVSFREPTGEWTDPKNLGSVINTKGYEMSPFLSGNKKRLYFSSNGHKGFGDADIFYSDRLDDSWEKWSAPVNLGKQINSKRFDAYFSLYDSVAYFSSNRTGQLSDLYMAKIKNPEDSTQQLIQKIVSEANSILTDLGDDTTDSLSASLQSVFIGFDHNTAQLNKEATEQLSWAAGQIKSRKLNKVTLVAYSSETEVPGNNLGYRRLEVIRNYFREIPLPNLTVQFEYNKKSGEDRPGKKGTVEVRLQQDNGIKLQP